MPQETDLPALSALDAACLAIDGPASVTWDTYQELLAKPGVAMLCAEPVQGVGQIVAVGWAFVKGDRGWIEGKVHPEHRRKGLGMRLLRWCQRQVVTFGRPERLVIRNEAVNEGSIALYNQEGYSRNFIENWMQRDLTMPLPSIEQRYQHVAWTPDNAQRFYGVYINAFRERQRPGSQVDSAEEWIGEYTADPDFRPGISLLALDDGKPVGFVTAGTMYIADLGKRIGWVSQVGSDPAWRGRGVAAGLIASVMEACGREGFDAVGLHVNVDNPGAIQVYEHLGFTLVGRRAVYSKPFM
jgi:GNAT superfamily N-acetyltransferase